jgi:hypothetical protein
MDERHVRAHGIESAYLEEDRRYFWFTDGAIKYQRLLRPGIELSRHICAATPTAIPATPIGARLPSI